MDDPKLAKVVAVATAVVGTTVGALLVRSALKRKAAPGGGARTLPWFARPRGADATFPDLAMAQLVPRAGSTKNAERIRALADRFRKVWPDVVPGEVLTPAMLEVMLSQIGGAEFTAYGKGWSGEMVGSENLGAYQCSANNPGGTAYCTCVARKDSMPMPDGTQKEFDTSFRFYRDGVTPDGKARSAADAAAWDYLHSVTRIFPALAEIRSGSILGYAWKQGINGYFGGFNATAKEQAAYAPSIAALVARGGLDARAKKVHASVEQVAGRIVKYAKAMGRVVPEIASALGHDRVYATLPADLAEGLAVAGAGMDLDEYELGTIFGRSTTWCSGR